MRPEQFGSIDPRTSGPLVSSTVNGLVIFDDFAKQACTDAINMANQTQKIMSDIVDKTQEARVTLREVIQGIGEETETLIPAKKKIIDELRGLRMTATSEAALMIKPLEEIRKFFLGAEHEREISRLKEFVELCERLENLKKSGFLDTVADTMLKLS